MSESPLEQILGKWTLHLAAGIEAVAMLIVAVAALLATASLVDIFIKRQRGPRNIDSARIQLGKGLVLALEFLVAADIVRTAVAPSWNEIGQLGAIVTLRVVLNYFLEQDIQRASQEAESSS